MVFHVYIFEFITHFYSTFVNIKLLSIHYLSSEMGISVLLNILSINSEY